jgi:hypothetical protein
MVTLMQSRFHLGDLKKVHMICYNFSHSHAIWKVNLGICVVEGVIFVVESEDHPH